MYDTEKLEALLQKAFGFTTLDTYSERTPKVKEQIEKQSFLTNEIRPNQTT